MRRIPWLIAAPIALILMFALKFSLRIPIWDGWTWILHLQRYESGQISLFDVLTLAHIEHPYGLPTLLFLTLGQACAYRFDPFGVLCATMLCVAMLVFLRGAHHDGIRSSVGFLLLAALLLTLRQSDNIVYAFQLGFPMTIALGLGAVWAAVRAAEAQRPRATAAWTATLILLASASMLCSAAAPAVFLGAAIPLLLSGRPVARKALAAVAIAGVFWVARYYLQIFRHTRARMPEAGGAADAVIGFCSVIGSGLTGQRTWSVTLGAIVVAAFVALSFFRTDEKRPVFLISSGALSLGLAATVTAGRGGMGGIVPSRYTSFTLPLVAAVLALLLRVFQDWRPLARWTATALCALLLAVSIGTSTVVAWQSGQWEQSHSAELTRIMTSDPPSSAREIALLNPGPTTLISSLVQFLRERKYNVFAPP